MYPANCKGRISGKCHIRFIPCVAVDCRTFAVLGQEDFPVGFRRGGIRCVALFTVIQLFRFGAFIVLVPGITSFGRGFLADVLGVGGEQLFYPLCRSLTRILGLRNILLTLIVFGGGAISTMRRKIL